MYTCSRGPISGLGESQALCDFRAQWVIGHSAGRYGSVLVWLWCANLRGCTCSRGTISCREELQALRSGRAQ
eukprot:10432308-Alexandrium_andersonii.AAC.1